MIEDAELLRRYVANRSEEAFAELVRRRLNLVYSVALRQVGGDAHLAEDVVQEVFTALARKAPALAQREVLGGWLYRTAQFSAIDAVRSQQRRRLREEKAHIMEEITGRETEHADWERLRPTLDQAIGELGDHDRDAVVLRFFEGSDYADIGRKLRLTENAARMRVQRALEKLETVLARRGVKSTTGALAVALGAPVAIAAPTGLALTVTSAALANASVASGATAAIGFMSTLKIYAVATTALALVGAFVWQEQKNELKILSQRLEADRESQTGEISRLREENTRLTAIADERASAVGTEKAQLARLRAENESLSKISTALVGAKLVAKTRTDDSSVAMPPTPASDTDAEIAARALQARRLIVRRFGSFLDQINLAPEKKEQLINLLVDRRESSVDLASASAASGSDPAEDLEGFSVSVHRLRGDVQEQIQALLGADDYARFLALDQAVAENAVIDRIQRKLRPGNSTLNSEQLSALHSLFGDLGINHINAEVVEHAARFLTPAQIAVLQQMEQNRKPLAQKPNVQKAVDRSLPLAPVGSEKK